MPQLRIDPLTGRRAWIAAERALRPHDFVARETPVPDQGTIKKVTPHRITPDDTLPRGSSEVLASCPFCGGNEAETPQAVCEVPGYAEPWRVRVVPNKYPALTLPDPAALSRSALGPPALGLSQRSLSLAQATEGEALGAHEVVIESRRHAVDWTELRVAELAEVLETHRLRVRHWADSGVMRHALVFKNCGFAAGASLAHVHSQLAAVPYVVNAVADELATCERRAQAGLCCWFCAEFARLQHEPARLVAYDEEWVAFCPPAPRQPFETWIMPRRHESHFETASPDWLATSAPWLRRVIAAVKHSAGVTAYNLALHSAPFTTTDFASPSSGHYHWHWELIPRVSGLAGMEIGGGIYIHSMMPEEAASQLRDVLTQES